MKDDWEKITFQPKPVLRVLSKFRIGRRRIRPFIDIL